MMARTAGFRIVRLQAERPGLGASGPSAFQTNIALPLPPPAASPLDTQFPAGAFQVYL